MLGADELVRGGAAGREPLVEPARRRRRDRILVPEPMGEPHGERRGQHGVADRSEGLRDGREIGLAQQEIGEAVGVDPCRARLDDLDGEPTQILDQDQPERDRHRPQLADAKRLGALKGQDEALQRGRVEAAVGVGDERPGQLERARSAGEWPLVERGQLPIEARRQIGANLVEHFLDDVEVVDEPLRRGRRRALFVDDGGQSAVAAEEDAPVFPGARKQAGLGPPIGRDAMTRDRLGQVFEPLDTEELGANGFRSEEVHVVRRRLSVYAELTLARITR